MVSNYSYWKLKTQAIAEVSTHLILNLDVFLDVHQCETNEPVEKSNYSSSNSSNSESPSSRDKSESSSASPSLNPQASYSTNIDARHNCHTICSSFQAYTKAGISSQITSIFAAVGRGEEERNVVLCGIKITEPKIDVFRFSNISSHLSTNYPKIPNLGTCPK